MVAQFQSLRSPFIIMFTIPLAFTGGLGALLIFDKEISISAMIGLTGEIVLTPAEGKIVRKYDEELGSPENGIAPGTWRKLRDDEVAWLRRMAKLKPETKYEEE